MWDQLQFLPLMALFMFENCNVEIWERTSVKATVGLEKYEYVSSVVENTCLGKTLSKNKWELIYFVIDISYTCVGKHHSQQKPCCNLQGLLGDPLKQSAKFCSPKVPRQRICELPNVGNCAVSIITYFSKSLKVATEQLLLPVVISSNGKSKVGIHTQVVLLFQC